MKVIQILPELNAGGVERGTLEVGKYLVDQGHESIVISNGGRLVTQLEVEGSRHITLPVHKKRLSSLKQVKVLRRLFEEERPDILHLRSRLPAWLAWLGRACFQWLLCAVSDSNSRKLATRRVFHACLTITDVSS